MLNYAQRQFLNFLREAPVHSTVVGLCQSAGVKPRTYYRWVQLPEFRQALTRDWSEAALFNGWQLLRYAQNGMDRSPHLFNALWKLTFDPKGQAGLAAWRQLNEEKPVAAPAPTPRGIVRHIGKVLASIAGAKKPDAGAAPLALRAKSARSDRDIPKGQTHAFAPPGIEAARARQGWVPGCERRSEHALPSVERVAGRSPAGSRASQKKAAVTRPPQQNQSLEPIRGGNHQPATPPCTPPGAAILPAKPAEPPPLPPVPTAAPPSPAPAPPALLPAPPSPPPSAPAPPPPQPRPAPKNIVRWPPAPAPAPAPAAPPPSPAPATLPPLPPNAIRCASRGDRAVGIAGLVGAE